MATERRAWSWRQMLLKSSLGSTTRHVLLTLSMHVNDAGEPCYPTTVMLAEETGLSERVVCLHLKLATEAGWIVVGRHGFSGKKWARNEYKLAWPDDKEGTDFNDIKKPEGTDSNDIKALTQSQCLNPDHIYGFPSSIPNTPISPVGDGAGFERFWQTYPKSRRIAKAACKRIWNRKGLDDDLERVMRVLVADICTPQWTKDDGQYVPMPSTWLQQDRFEREVGSVAHERRCSVCGGVAGYRIGARHYCQQHFNEAPRE